MSYYDVSGDDAAGLAALLGDYDISGAQYDAAGLSWENVLMPHTLLQQAMQRRGGGGRSAPAYHPAAAQRMPPALASRAAYVQQREPAKSRRLILPVDSGTTIATTVTSTIAVTPTNVFKPDRLVVDPVIAPAFLINDIKIGRASQLIGSGSIPATLFAPSLGDNNIGFDTVQTSQPISISVTNTSGASLRFTGSFVGWEVE